MNMFSFQRPKNEQKPASSHVWIMFSKWRIQIQKKKKKFEACKKHKK